MGLNWTKWDLTAKNQFVTYMPLNTNTHIHKQKSYFKLELDKLN